VYIFFSNRSQINFCELESTPYRITWRAGLKPPAQYVKALWAGRASRLEPTFMN
jgi:hypothetical protein